ncbi:hypothetical protein BJV78DRAFT_1352465 [Lactifluus subvellereus]|nr:hypothetical protein BJV78DRAFT_1352465 [Lactifluus subvellereus]
MTCSVELVFLSTEWSTVRYERCVGQNIPQKGFSGRSSSSTKRAASLIPVKLARDGDGGDDDDDDDDGVNEPRNRSAKRRCVQFLRPSVAMNCDGRTREGARKLGWTDGEAKFRAGQLYRNLPTRRLVTMAEADPEQARLRSLEPRESWELPTFEGRPLNLVRPGTRWALLFSQ